MTIAELKEVIKDLPDEMEVRYEYDGGHSFPTFKTHHFRNICKHDYEDPKAPLCLVLDENDDL